MHFKILVHYPHTIPIQCFRFYLQKEYAHQLVTMILLQNVYVAKWLKNPFIYSITSIFLIIQMHRQINYTNIKTCVRLIDGQLKVTHHMVHKFPISLYYRCPLHAINIYLHLLTKTLNPPLVASKWLYTTNQFSKFINSSSSNLSYQTPQ